MAAPDRYNPEGEVRWPFALLTGLAPESVQALGTRGGTGPLFPEGVGPEAFCPADRLGSQALMPKRPSCSRTKRGYPYLESPTVAPGPTSGEE